MTIADKIRSARLKLGFTQRYVAKAMKVRPSAVNQWESGETEPSYPRRAKLAALLNIPTSDLIPGSADEIKVIQAR